MIKCPECEGFGTLVYDVVGGGPMDWHGSYIEEKEIECESCFGSGEVDGDEPDE